MSNWQSSEMDLIQKEELCQQRLTAAKQMLAELKGRKAMVQQEIHKLKITNNQTRNRYGSDEVNMHTLALSENDLLKRNFVTLVTTKKRFKALKDFEENEKRFAGACDREIIRTLQKFDIGHFKEDIAALHQEITEMKKQMEERKKLLTQLAEQKKSAKVKRTKKIYDEKIASLVTKRSELQLKIWNLKMERTMSSI